MFMVIKMNKNISSKMFCVCVCVGYDLINIIYQINLSDQKTLQMFKCKMFD